MASKRPAKVAPDDHADTRRVAYCALVGVEAGIAFADGVSACPDARSLTGARYVSDTAVVADGATTAGGAAMLSAFYPGTGRGVLGGVRASL